MAIKRILIVNNAPSTKVDASRLFKNSGFDAECIVTRNISSAAQQIEIWKRDGFAADIISVDYNLTMGDMNYLAARAAHFDQKPPPPQTSTPTKFDRFLNRWFKTSLPSTEQTAPKQLAYKEKQENLVKVLTDRRASGNVEDLMRENIIHSPFNGLNGTRYLIKLAREYPDYLRPKQFFIHSADMSYLNSQEMKEFTDIYGIDNKINKHLVQELIDISNLGKGDLEATNKEKNHELRKYLNDNFQAHYPLTDEETAKRRGPEARFTIDEMDKVVKAQNLSPLETLGRLDLEDLLHELGDRIDSDDIKKHKEDLIGFAKYTGNDISGKLALSVEKAKELRQQGHKAILVLEDFDPGKDEALLSGVDGIALLGEGGGHLEIITSNSNISSAITLRDNHLVGIERDEDDEGHTIANLVFDTLDDEGVEAIAITEGTDITIGHCKSQVRLEDHLILDRGARNMAAQVITNLGALFKGNLKITKQNPLVDKKYAALIACADELLARHNGPGLMCNVDNPEQVKSAIAYGASGIGLLRTEHTFLKKERVIELRKAMLAETDHERQPHLESLRNFQKEDFTKVFLAANEAKGSFPVTIRLLDAPPDEFLTVAEIEQFNKRVGGEANNRGAQFAARTPGFYAMQAEAIFESAKETGFKHPLSITIPLIRTAEELKTIKDEIAHVAEKHGMQGQYKFGAVIETIDAIKNISEIAKLVEVLSYGTNDLTSEVIGLKRNDIVAIQKWMADHEHYGKNPFLKLVSKVIELLDKATLEARRVNPSISITACGQQICGDVSSIQACQKMGIDYLSVPATPQHLVATKIIAAQAVLLHYN